MALAGPHSSGNEGNSIRRAIEAAAIFTVLAVSAALAFQLWIMLDVSGAWWLAAFAILLGYILADLLSGMVHWLADRFGTDTTPVLGPAFIQPFREHHTDPQAITKHDFIETNGNNSIATITVLIPAYVTIPASPESEASIFLSALVLSASLSLHATNQFHKWAHLEKPPALAKFLQRLRLILTKDHHQVHHTSPFDTYYCITTGWLNWPLQRLRFFEIMEWVVNKACLGKIVLTGKIKTLD